MIALLFTQRTYYALRNAKKSYFPFAFHSFFRKFAIEDGLVFRFAQGNFSVSAKKETGFFVLRSTLRNFVAE